MPDAARPASDLLYPGLAARRLAGGLRQFLSLDRRLPTCQLRQVRTCRRIRSDQLSPNQRHRALAAGLKELASIPDAGAASPRRSHRRSAGSPR
jgi:hypothetical protein